MRLKNPDVQIHEARYKVQISLPVPMVPLLAEVNYLLDFSMKSWYVTEKDYPNIRCEPRANRRVPDVATGP